MPGLGQGHQDTKIRELFFIMAFLMSLRLINEKTPLFNLNPSSPPAVRRAGLWVFVPWWLNSYQYSKFRLQNSIPQRIMPFTVPIAFLSHSAFQPETGFFENSYGSDVIFKQFGVNPVKPQIPKTEF